VGLVGGVDWVVVVWLLFYFDVVVQYVGDCLCLVEGY